MKLELLKSEKQRIESEREKERRELEEIKRQLKEKIDFEEQQEQLKRNSFIGSSAIASITEESGSLVDDDASQRLAHQIKKESTQIERGIYKHLKIYEPATQPASDSRIQVFGEPNEKETKTLMVLGAPDRGKDEFINSLANHLWDVKVPDRFRFKLVLSNKDDASLFSVYKLNNTKLSYNTTIVDVPELSDEEPSKVLSSLVKNCKELKLVKFHALCHVVRALDKRLSNGEKVMFLKVPKLFTKSPDVNIVANFSNDAEPPIKNALITENISHHNIFKLNTIFIENGTSNFDEFLDYLNSNNSPRDMESRSRHLFGTIGRSVRDAGRRLTRSASWNRK